MLGLRVDEPVTTLTDLVISAVCLYAFAALRKSTSSDPIHTYLKYYFLSMAAATFLGGVIGHGFLYLFDGRWRPPAQLMDLVSRIVGAERVHGTNNPWKLPGWLAGMVAVSCMERSSIELARPFIGSTKVRCFFILSLVELSVFAILAIATLNFLFVGIHALLGVVVTTFLFNWYVYYRSKDAASRFFLIGVGFSAAAATFFVNGWDIAVWFNRTDISHIFMALSAWFFLRGAETLAERSPADRTRTSSS